MDGMFGTFPLKIFRIKSEREARLVNDGPPYCSETWGGALGATLVR